MARTVAVAVDDNRQASDAAFRRAVEQCDKNGRLLILYARPVENNVKVITTPHHLVYFRMYTQHVERAYAEESKELLGRYATLAMEAKLDFKAVEVQGPPHEAVAARCAEEKTDLLIVGTTRRRKLLNLFRDKSMERVVANAPCRIIVVEPEAAQPTRRMARRRIGPGENTSMVGQAS